MRPLAVLLLSALAAAPAAAQPAQPSYAQWADRARSADAPALAALATQAPAFGRVWFYGNLFDLAVPQIPQAQRDALRPRLRAVAEALADGDSARWLGHPDLASAFGQVQGMRDAWLANSRAGDPIGPMLATAQRPELAPPIFYRLLYRAGLSAAARDPLDVATARHMAAGHAVITGDLALWRALATWHGGAVPPTGPQDTDDALTRALNARDAGDARGLQRHGEVALDSARRRRPDSLYTALVLNLSGLAAGWSGRAQAALTLRVQVLQMVRPLKLPRLDAALLGGLLDAALAGPRLADARTWVDQLAALGTPALATRPTARRLLEGLATLDARMAQARAESDDATLDQALQVYFPLAALVETPAIGGLLSPPPGPALASRVAAARSQQGALAMGRGLFAEAAEGFGQAADGHRALGQREPAVLAEVAQADALWSAGREGEARATLTGLIGVSGGAQRALVRQTLGALRLAGGDPAPAFAHANSGLRTLAGAEPEARSRLHALAAQALHMAGFTRHAARRAEQGMRLAPADPWLPRFAVSARLALGDEAAALAAADALRAAAPDEAAVLRGCVLTRIGKHAEALERLAAVGKLAQPRQTWQRLEGMLCRVHAQMEVGEWAAAHDGLRAARSTALAMPDPVLDWRLRVLEGRDFAHQKKWLDAAGVWRQALITLSTLGAEIPARGALVSVGSVAPGDPMAVADALVDALVAASQADRKRADVHLRAAMGVALWARQVAAAPRGSALPAAAWRPAEDRARHRLLARLARTRGTLAQGGQTSADRARLTQHLRNIASGLTTAAAKLHAASPAWASYLTPRLEPKPSVPDGALVVYHFGARGHAFVGVEGQPVRHFPLARADVIRAALVPAMAVVQDPARRPDWAALRAPLKAVMPYLDDAKVAKTLLGKPLWIVPDGPLVAFPLAALVTDVAGPTFVGDAWQIRRAVVAQAPPKIAAAQGLGAIGANDKETHGVLAGGPPTPANPASFQADFAARGTQWITASADLQAGVLSLTGDAAGRLGEADLAFGPGGATAVVLSRATAPLDSGAGVRRMAAALHHRGVRDLIWVTGRVDGDVAFGHQVAAAIRAGRGVGEALRQVQATARKQTPHPHAWARWMHAEALPTR